MNFSLKLAAATLALAGVAGVANADTGNPASATAQASVTVVNPITVAAGPAMDFGTITSAAVSGDIVLENDGDRTDTIGGPQTVGGDGIPATFNISTVESYPYDATLASSNNNGFLISALTPSISLTNIIGSSSVSIGATLTVPAGVIRAPTMPGASL